MHFFPIHTTGDSSPSTVIYMQSTEDGWQGKLVFSYLRNNYTETCVLLLSTYVSDLRQTSIILRDRCRAADMNKQWKQWSYLYKQRFEMSGKWLQQKTLHRNKRIIEENKNRDILLKEVMQC
jgi:hypothetical protein